MNRRARAMRLVALAAFAAGLVAVVAPAEGSAVTGKAGLDTSLPLTDSKVTLSGRGSFSALKVTVNQTKNLVNQAVSVTWSGGAPTRSGPGRFAANYLQVMQCWGDDDGTNAANPGPPPSKCVAGATNGIYGGISPGLLPPGSFTAERIQSRKGWENFDESQGVFDDRTGYLWQPFKSVTGVEVGVHFDPKFNPIVEGGSYWLNSFFNIITTNEIVAGRTGPNGEGAELFELNTGIESSGLGCGQRVEALPDGSKRVPKCWLVVVPRGTPEEENLGTPFAQSAATQGVMTSPLAPNAWKNRIAFPLEFNPVESKCSLSDEQRRVVGSELALRAVGSWQPALCSVPGRTPYAYGPIADDTARLQIVNPAAGAAGMAVVSRPIPQEQLDATSPVVYAPLTVSGIVIGFNVERAPKPDADAEAQAVAGKRIAQINLTPRVVAKLLTQSYRSQVEIKSVETDYEWVKENPGHLGDDPDFLQFNPEFTELEVRSGKNFGGLLLPPGNSDMARQVWEYVLTDPEARKWLDGTPDEFGMKVNPIYATTAAANVGGAAFGDPVPASFPKGDPHCYQGPNQGNNGDVVPPPLCGTDWLPYTGGLRESARLTRAADDRAKVVEDPFAQSSDQVYKRDTPQQIGSRTMLSLTDSASASLYGLQTARLSRAGDGGSARAFIAPDAAGLTKGLDGFKPGAEVAVLEPVPSQKAEGGYPLTALTYAAIKPLEQPANARTDYADFVEYAAKSGQVYGPLEGQLPDGYAPLPDALQTQTTNAAKAIRELTAAAVESGEFMESLGLPAADVDGSTSSRSSFDGGDSDFSFGDSAASSSTPGSVAETVAVERAAVTPTIAIAATRFAIPLLGAIALLAALASVEMSRRPARVEKANA